MYNCSCRDHIQDVIT